MATVERYRFPPDLWYESREHLWVRVERGDAGGAAPDVGRDGAPTVTIGIDEMGQEALGEVVYVDLLGAGAAVRRGAALGSLEAEKMVRPVLAPVSGTLLDVNDALLAAPRLLNSDPYGAGWLVRIRASRWEAERADLLHGDEAVAAWARRELEAER
ncbi:MAG: hypothetical protein A3F92_15665 [Candidatus Rokubacteria bacterium RIFCSPLOWO2_12_FULL_71_22]|nr:MAG: hypothetical protein A3F92_15665 [Candidatus Rokubacteria bacterium RIFCSPLOWO2_12_FULL_71_22]